MSEFDYKWSDTQDEFSVWDGTTKLIIVRNDNGNIWYNYEGPLCMDESYLWLIQRAFNYAMYIAHENWVTTNEC
jgi:hypothetical protein